MSGITKDPIKCYFYFIDSCKKGEFEIVSHLCSSVGADYLKMFFKDRNNIPYNDIKIGPFLLFLELSLGTLSKEECYRLAIENGHLEINLKLIEDNPLKSDKDYYDIYMVACKNDNVDIIKRIMNIKPNLLTVKEIREGIDWALRHDKLNVVQFLLPLYNDDPRCLSFVLESCSFRAKSDRVFKYLSELHRAKYDIETNCFHHFQSLRTALQFGSIDIAKYILSLNLNIDFRYNDDDIFKTACKDQNLAAISYLCSICNLYDYMYNYETRRIRPIIHVPNPMRKYLKTNEECMICHENENVHNIKCAGKYDHYYCNSCFDRISKNNKKCVFCLTPF